MSAVRCKTISINVGIQNFAHGTGACNGPDCLISGSRSDAGHDRLFPGTSDPGKHASVHQHIAHLLEKDGWNFSLIYLVPFVGVIGLAMWPLAPCLAGCCKRLIKPVASSKERR